MPDGPLIGCLVLYGGSSLIGKVLDCESREQGSKPGITQKRGYGEIGRHVRLKI